MLATGTRNGPLSGITFYKGVFYIAEGGELEGGRILRVSKTGEITPIIFALPTYGDHHTNGPVIKDRLYLFWFGHCYQFRSGGRGQRRI